jgi:hypothetical protein
MKPSQKTKNSFDWGSCIVDPLFFAAFCAVLVFRVRPLLSIDEQAPVFLTGTRFLVRFLQVPGGAMDWLAALCSRFFFSDWAATAVMTLAAWAVSALTRSWIRALSGLKIMRWMHLIPAVLLLGLMHRYDFPFSAALGLAFACGLAAAFEKADLPRTWMRLGLAAVFLMLLYWTAGANAWVFAAAVGLSEIIVRRRLVSGLGTIALAALLPFVFSATVFLVGKNAAWLHGSALENAPRLGIAWALFGFYLLVPVAVAFRKWFRKTADRIAGMPRLVKWIAGAACVAVVSAACLPSALNRPARAFLSIGRAARAGAWVDVLRLCENAPIQNEYTAFQANRALFHTDRLLSGLFTRPQPYGTAGLIPGRKLCFTEPLEACDFFFKLGLVGESQHWAHEAFAVLGPTVEVSERLARIYLAKGEPAAASLFLTALKKTPFPGGEARQLLESAGTRGAPGYDEAVYEAETLAPKTDFISLGSVSDTDLRRLLDRNPKNRMAFEYWTAWQLLSRGYRSILEARPELDRFYPQAKPRPVQEALLLAAATTPNFSMKTLASSVAPTVVTRFRSFQSVLAKHQNRPEQAQSELQERFGDTFWYYVVYTRPGVQQGGSK